MFRSSAWLSVLSADLLSPTKATASLSTTSGRSWSSWQRWLTRPGYLSDGQRGPLIFKIEQVLRKSNTAEPRDLGDQFALLVSSVVDYGIFMLDPSGVVVTWNEGAQRIKGYAATEIIGRHFSVFYPAEEIRNRKPDWELEVARREGRYEEEGWRIRKDGTRFWANVIITALRDESGRLRGFGKVTRDLTEPRAQEIQRNLDREKEALQLR